MNKKINQMNENKSAHQGYVLIFQRKEMFKTWTV